MEFFLMSVDVHSGNLEPPTHFLSMYMLKGIDVCTHKCNKINFLKKGDLWINAQSKKLHKG